MNIQINLEKNAIITYNKNSKLTEHVVKSISK